MRQLIEGPCSGLTRTNPQFRSAPTCPKTATARRMPSAPKAGAGRAEGTAARGTREANRVGATAAVARWIAAGPWIVADLRAAAAVTWIAANPWIAADTATATTERLLSNLSLLVSS